jgi:hypothetical protein
MWTQQDKAAISGLLTRYVITYDLRRAWEEKKEEAEKQLADLAVQVANFKAAFDLFNIDIFNKDCWIPVRTELGELAFARAVEAGQAAAKQKQGLLPAQGELVIEHFEPGKTEKMISAKGGPGQQVEPRKPAVKEAVLEYLRVVGPSGSKIVPIREYVEKTYSMKIHEKTVGMTLYRLSRTGLVRREGRTWFFVPPRADTKSPGVAAPGPSQTEQNGKV